MMKEKLFLLRQPDRAGMSTFEDVIQTLVEANYGVLCNQQNCVLWGFHSGMVISSQ